MRSSNYSALPNDFHYTIMSDNKFSLSCTAAIVEITTLTTLYSRGIKPRKSYSQTRNALAPVLITATPLRLSPLPLPPLFFPNAHVVLQTPFSNKTKQVRPFPIMTPPKLHANALLPKTQLFPPHRSCPIRNSTRSNAKMIVRDQQPGEKTQKKKTKPLRSVMSSEHPSPEPRQSFRPNIKLPYIPPTSALATGIFLIPHDSAPIFHPLRPSSLRCRPSPPS